MSQQAMMQARAKARGTILAIILLVGITGVTLASVYLYGLPILFVS